LLTNFNEPLQLKIPRFNRTGSGCVELHNVTVSYQMATERVKSLKEVAIRALTGRSVKFSEFRALSDVNMEVKQGEGIALVGRNGAGKSTMLKIIARVHKPTRGRVIVRGTISPLIELGAGFHPELTGRENVMLNGAMLGFSRRDMERKFPSIVEFSGLENFIDSPVRAYSSGMVARLGFAVAADADPDILIIDEALSVGDEAFQLKCLARMNEFRSQGVTVFFVTHGLDIIKTLCERTVWLDAGQIRMDGETEEVIQAFRKSMIKDDDLAETQKRQVVRLS
jgi:ABC-type polysaccharide/polyol phosphate transport system ATPase subunit